ncbi:hypothetical protein [Acinetobacter sp. ACNIH2]|uniref:hypothetical protein n=1 Tax=Acinetobacter sp. ACNIH2 TaxID=1758189 RepID=UPI00131569F6|nr:hypothetical protein [Acinetobacter sp. ACNIH2]
MTTWYYKYIDDLMLAASESNRYSDAVFALDLSMGGNSHSSIFSRMEEYNGVHFYFSPEAKPIALMFNATPCDQPSKNEIGNLLVGDATLLSRLFP